MSKPLTGDVIPCSNDPDSHSQEQCFEHHDVYNWLNHCSQRTSRKCILYLDTRKTPLSNMNYKPDSVQTKDRVLKYEAWGHNIDFLPMCFELEVFHDLASNLTHVTNACLIYISAPKSLQSPVLSMPCSTALDILQKPSLLVPFPFFFQ